MSTIEAVAKSNDLLTLIKSKQKATWEDGDYASFAKFMEAGAVEVLQGWDIPRAAQVLDVGCGSGQTAIPAAKQGAIVTGADIAQNLIEHARQRASEARLQIRFDVADAEDLPYENEQFDIVISMFGAMFAPRPQKVVSEFARVTRPGGKLYMANWTPHGMPAQMFKAIAKVAPPPPGFVAPSLWGDENTVKLRLGNDFTDIQLTRKQYPQWHYPFGSNELVALFRKFFGPVKKAFDSVGKQEQLELHQTLEQIYKTNSETQNGVLTIINGEYLEVVATRR